MAIQKQPMIAISGVYSLLVVLLSIVSDTVATSAADGLSDPAQQPKFTTPAPNLLDPSFVYVFDDRGTIEITINEGIADTGLFDSNGNPVMTPIWGYGMDDDVGYTWPGRTFEVQAYEPITVTWFNKLPINKGYLLTGIGALSDTFLVDTSYHWCYSIPGYEDFSIVRQGTPIVPHLHGAHNDAPFDGNPEYFFAPNFGVRGPQWHPYAYLYDNSQPAGCLWYHDHALGITRTNVHTGLTGFYIIRDLLDTGRVNNPLRLPAFPYEIPLVIQDRMFKANGELFYPAFDDFREVEDNFNSPYATELAEFFGDHITVNGKIWPKLNVEPRQYRLRLLNACDSRFMVIQMNAIGLDEIENKATGIAVTYTVIGGDQGFADSPTQLKTLVFEPSARYDVIVDFAPYEGRRVVMNNIGGDEPFGGDIPGPVLFEDTDKVMAFDVILPFDTSVPNDFEPEFPQLLPQKEEIPPDRTRRVGLFEGEDHHGRLLPLLGTVDPATDMDGTPINWPNEKEYKDIGLVGQMIGTATWHDPTTENIRLGDVEEWEIWNVSADAHPIHLHLVHFSLVNRKWIVFDSLASDEGIIERDNEYAEDGTFITPMPLVQHDGNIASGFKVVNPTVGELIDESTLPEYVTNFPNDVIVALPGQVTTIRAKFDKPGRYNWHCHILAHEDHEMMRIFHVGPLPDDQKGGVSPTRDVDEADKDGAARGRLPMGLWVLVPLIVGFRHMI